MSPDLFPTDVMMVVFAGAMTSLPVDMLAKRWRMPRGHAVGGVASAFVAAALGMVLLNWRPYIREVSVQPVASGLSSLYVVDSFTVFLLFTVLVVGLTLSCYAALWLSKSDNVGPLYALLLLLLGSLVGVISAGDFLTLFLFWEAMSLSAYGLVCFRRSDPLSVEAALKYFFMAGIGSLVFLYGVALLYSQTGSVLLSSVAGTSPGSALSAFGIVMVVVGLGVEAAIVPLHAWLPDVYSAAPTPVASVVAGAVTGTAVFAVVKVVYPLAGAPLAVASPVLQWVLVALALLTMFVGNLTGLAQANVRRMLGCSSIAQTGYMLAAISTLTPLGLVAVVFNIWNHALLKSNFFILVGARGEGYEDADLSRLGGLGRRSKALGVLFTSSSLGMVGSPPFGLFWSEILIVRSLLSVSGPVFFWLAVAVVLNVVLSIGYYYRVINTVVFGSGGGQEVRVPKAPVLASAALIGLSILTGLLPSLFLGLLT